MAFFFLLLTQPLMSSPLFRLLSHSLVDLYVGPENTHWVLHEKLLCHHSPFFRKIFYAKKGGQGRTQAFGLPEEEDGPFKAFVGWLYSSSLAVPGQEAELGICFDVYLMAEKFGIPRLMADVLHVVRAWYRDSNTYPGLRRVQYVYANTEEGSPMRKMLVDSVARLLVLGKGMPAHWDKALRKNGQLAVDLIRAVQGWGLEEEAVPDAREEVDEAGVEGDEEEKGEEEEEGEADDSEVTVVEKPAVPTRLPWHVKP